MRTLLFWLLSLLGPVADLVEALAPVSMTSQWFARCTAISSITCPGSYSV